MKLLSLQDISPARGLRLVDLNLGCLPWFLPTFALPYWNFGKKYVGQTWKMVVNQTQVNEQMEHPVRYISYGRSLNLEQQTQMG